MPIFFNSCGFTPSSARRCRSPAPSPSAALVQASFLGPPSSISCWPRGGLPFFLQNFVIALLAAFCTGNIAGTASSHEQPTDDPLTTCCGTRRVFLCLRRSKSIKVRDGLNKDPRRPVAPIVAKPARYGSVAVSGERNRPALLGGSDRAGADQLVALLGPDTIFAGENPYRPGVPVARPAHQGGIAVGGERNRHALIGGSIRAGADQLVALLGLDTVAAGENPYRPRER